MIKRLPNPNRWATIPAAALEDNRLSWKARGLLAFILAKPDDWEIRREQLIASSDHDGIRSVKGALKELVDLGYAELVTARSADGKHLAGQRYNVSDQAETFWLQNVSVTKRFGNESAPVTNIPEETKDQEEDYRPKRAQKRAREEERFYDGDEGERLCAACNEPEGLNHVAGCVFANEEQDGLAMGKDKAQQFPRVTPEDFARLEAMRAEAEEISRRDLARRKELGIDGDHGCALYHPGFPCAHEQEALAVVAESLWDSMPPQSRRRRVHSHQLLHAFVHESLDTFRDDVRQVATWWREHRARKDWSIPLMFSRPGEVLANAQATQAPGGETGLERYIRTLQENDHATT